MKTQYVGRKGSFDAGHRVMNQNFACKNMHGHTYLYKLVFAYNQEENIGYAIDFKEIKRIGIQWLLDFLDHGMILNPEDGVLIQAAKDSQSKFWLMTLENGNFCNPTAENIAKEIFLAMKILFPPAETGLRIHKVKLNETPNCWTVVKADSISEKEELNFMYYHRTTISAYRKSLGEVIYDSTKISGNHIQES